MQSALSEPEKHCVMQSIWHPALKDVKTIIISMAVA